MSATAKLKETADFSSKQNYGVPIDNNLRYRYLLFNITSFKASAKILVVGTSEASDVAVTLGLMLLVSFLKVTTIFLNSE